MSVRSAGVHQFGRPGDRSLGNQASKDLTQRSRRGTQSTPRRENMALRAVCDEPPNFGRVRSVHDRTPREAPESLLLGVLCASSLLLCVESLLAYGSRP